MNSVPISSQEKNLDARVLHRIAQEHYVAFIILRRHLKNKIDLASILYFHGLRSIELIMKSFVRQHGISKEYLKNNIKHDLRKLAMAVDSLGFPLDLRHRYVILVYNPFYRGKIFEYPDEKTRKVPSLKQLNETVLYVFGLLEPYLLDEFKKEIPFKK